MQEPENKVEDTAADPTDEVRVLDVTPDDDEFDPIPDSFTVPAVPPSEEPDVVGAPEE